MAYDDEKETEEQKKKRKEREAQQGYPDPDQQKNYEDAQRGFNKVAKPPKWFQKVRKLISGEQVA